MLFFYRLLPEVNTLVCWEQSLSSVLQDLLPLCISPVYWRAFTALLKRPAAGIENMVNRHLPKAAVHGSSLVL